MPINGDKHIGDTGHVADHNAIENELIRLAGLIASGTGSVSPEDVQAIGDVRYATIVHSHAIANVTNLQNTLDGKAATSHQHNASAITSGLLGAAYAPAQSVMFVKQNADNSWPARPTNRSDVMVIWRGATDPGAVRLQGVDVFWAE